jgi:protocatechuate 3,4-dioxygenase beta subunit
VKARFLLVILGLLLLMAISLALLWRPHFTQAPAPAPARARVGLQPVLATDDAVALASIEGRVLDGDGRALDGAVVAAVLLVDGAAPRPVALTRSQKGRFRLADLPAGTFAVSATLPGRRSASKKPLVVAESETLHGVELVLAEGGVAVSGTVSDAGGGPIAGARIWAWRWDEKVDFFVESDVAGRYRIDLAPGSYQLRADAEGYGRRRAHLTIDVPQTLDWQLQPAATVSGRVVLRSTGEGVADALVTLRPQHAFESFETHSKSDGRFELSDVEPGEYFAVARKDGLQGRGTRSFAVGPGGQASSVVIAMEPGRTLLGQVLDPDGVPQKGARVFLTAVQAHGNGRTVMSGDEGRWKLEGVVPGVYQMTAALEGFDLAFLPQLVVAERDLDGVKLSLVHGAEVSGVVRTPDGQPAADAVVNLIFMGARSMPMPALHSDGEGRFRQRGFGTGVLSVQADHPSGTLKMDPFPIARGERKQLELQLEAGSSLQGHVRWDDGGDAAGVLVSVSGGRHRATAATDERGRFRIDKLLPGEVTLEVSRQARDDIFSSGDSDPLKVTLPRRDDIELTVPRGGQTLTGKVVDGAGRPVVNASLIAALQGGDDPMLRYDRRQSAERRPQFTGADGTFRFEDLSRGQYSLRVTHPEHPDHEQHDVASGSAVTLTLADGVVLAGTVVDERGRPADDFTLSLYQGEGEAATRPVRSDVLFEAHGQFEVRGLSDGVFSILARDNGGHVGGVSGIAVQSGEARRDLRLALQSGVSIHGTLRDPAGKPLADGTVWLSGAGASVFLHTSDDGSFAASGFAAGRPIHAWGFAMQSTGVALQTFTVPDGQERYELTLAQIDRKDL